MKVIMQLRNVQQSDDDSVYPFHGGRRRLESITRQHRFGQPKRYRTARDEDTISGQWGVFVLE
jgi:hypothetical protein